MRVIWVRVANHHADPAVGYVRYRGGPVWEAELTQLVDAFAAAGGRVRHVGFGRDPNGPDGLDGDDAHTWVAAVAVDGDVQADACRAALAEWLTEVGVPNAWWCDTPGADVVRARTVR